MKTFKAFLILTFLSCSFLAQALDLACIGKDDTVSPNPKTYTDSAGVTHDTQPWIDWKNSHPNHSISRNWGCCNKLVREGDTCKDKSIVDESLQTCSGPSDHGSCPSTLGCYKLRVDEDLFNADPEDPAQEEQMLALEDKFEEQQSKELGDNDPKENGQLCYRNLECASYSCEKFKCVDRFICREADLDEFAPGNIECESPLVKDTATGKCITAGVNFFSGLIGDVAVQQLSGQQCQFQVVPTKPNLTFKDLKNAVNLSVLSLRSMEWLFSTASGSNHNECQFVMQMMRDRFVELVNERKEVLHLFNKDMIFIEDNFALINGAKKDDLSNVSTLCTDAAGNYEMTTKHDVALRKASGKDFLCYLKRRNLLFKEYEKAMFSWAAKVQALVKNYNDTVFTWGEKDKSWNVLGTGKSYKDRDCRDWSSWHKKVKKRWGQRYKVAPGHDINKKITDKENIIQFLKYVDSEAVSKFTNKRYFLLDPLLPGGYQAGVSFGDYGLDRNFNGKFDRYLKRRAIGGKARGYEQIYDGFSTRLPEFYKSLPKGIDQDKFIYEPEIASSYEYRGCMNKIDDPKCAPFKEWITMVQDMSFVQMISYSHHSRKKYKSYYSNENTLRRKLFNNLYDVSLVNLSKYYAALSGTNGLRDKQDACLTRAIDQFEGEDFKGEGVGVTEGSTNYYQATDNTYLQNNKGPSKYLKPNIKVNSGIPAKFLLAGHNFSLKNSGEMDNNSSQGTGASSGTLSSQASSALAARVKLMEDTNAKAISKGVDVAAKDATLRQSLASVGQLSALGGNGANAGQRGSSFGSLGGANSSSQGNSDKDSDKESGEQGKFEFGGYSLPGVGGKSGSDGIVGGAGSGSGFGSSSGSSASQNDPSGLSDEEKDVMSANYERNKRDYKPNEEDTLFQVLSKTYVRNLDKVLTRKKKLDDEAESRQTQKP